MSIYILQRLFFVLRMAHSIDSVSYASDEYVDLYCKICSKSKGLKVRIYGYCEDCDQYLCSDCNVVHSNLDVARDHVIVRGKSMPASESAKPPMFDRCEVHPKLLMDLFCSDHKFLLCSSCSASSKHKDCSVGTVDAISKAVQSSEINTLYESVMNAVHGEMKAVLSEIKTHREKISAQKISMLKEAQTRHGNVTAKLNNLYENTQKEIKTQCESQVSLLDQLKRRLKTL